MLGKSRNTYYATRLREVYLNGKWIANTNYQEQILTIEWKDATKKIGELNSIALLLFHICYYLKGIQQVLDGGPLEIKDKYSFTMPEIKSSEDWEKLVKDFLSCAASFADSVEQLNDEIFDNVFVDEKYGNYQRNIEAVIEHSYYHLGQICLINKMIQQGY